MDSYRFRIEMEFMLTTGFWLLTTRKTARFCNWLRIPPCPQSTGRPGSSKRKTANDCRTPRRRRRYEEGNPRRLRRWVFTCDRNQPAGLVQANGRRQMIAVLQNGCAVIHLRSQSTGCSRSIWNCLPTEMGEEPSKTKRLHAHVTYWQSSSKAGKSCRVEQMLQRDGILRVR